VIYDFTVKWDAADQGKPQFVSAVLTLWLAMAGPSKRVHMDDMAIEGELYMDSDSEEEICIDNEIGNFPPH
jgi:hypothetical protein